MCSTVYSNDLQEPLLRLMLESLTFVCFVFVVPFASVKFETSVGQNGTKKLSRSVIVVAVSKGQQAER